MADSNDPAEEARNAASSATLAHAFLGIYGGVMLFSLNTDWRYVRNLKRARISMTFRFLNRYVLLFALILLTLTFDVTNLTTCRPLSIASTVCCNIALELASICFTLRIIAAATPRRWVSGWAAISVLLVLGLLAQAGLLSYAPVKATWVPKPGPGCVFATGLGRGVLTIRYTVATVYSATLLALAGWTYAALCDLTFRFDRLSGQEVFCFGAACIASAMNIVFIWVDLDPVGETMAMTLPTIIVSIASCRVIALWDDALREYDPSNLQNCGKLPPLHFISFIGRRAPLSGRSAKHTHKTPGFQRLSSAAGSVVGTSAPSSIILPSIIAPSPTYDPRLSQGTSSYLGSSGSALSAQGDCYDPDLRRKSTERGVNNV